MRILFVESDNDLRAFFGSKLREEFKGTIDIASTGKEAIKLMRSERPYDVIIGNHYLSKGSGADLLHFKIKNKITGAFIFFSAVQAYVQFPEDEYQQFDQFCFRLLCEEIKSLRAPPEHFCKF